jgi:hypothetical protein
MVRNPFTMTLYPCSFSAPFIANHFLPCAVDLFHQAAQSVLCVPSQNGGFLVCLH